MHMLTSQTISVGVDVHKYGHSAVALDAFGQERGRFEFTNGTLSPFSSWLLSLGDKKNIVIGLEDTNCYGTHMVEHLRNESFLIRYVPAILTERERKLSTKRHKSDYLDAKRVGRVILGKFEETLPAKESIADHGELETARELDLLLMERRDLVKDKTILKNQLHGLLHQRYTEDYRAICQRSFGKKVIKRFLSDLASDDSLLGASITRRLERLLFVEEQIYAISKEISAIGERSAAAKALAVIHGCGMITACAIVAEVITVRRFRDRDSFAMYAGVSPVPHSSGRKSKLHTNPFGNRRLNRAIHAIALSQIAIKGDPEGKEYYRKKLSEGKTKLWALRCLKHQISRRVFQILKQSEIK